MFRLLLGTAGVIGAGYVMKKYYDENQEIVDEKIEDSLLSVYDWLDEKSVALDKYLDSLDDEKNQSHNFMEEEITLESLQQMKKKVYHDSFVSFLSFYKKVNNVDLGKLELQDIDFTKKIYGNEIFDENIQNNIKIITDLLFKANNLLNDILINLDELIKNNNDYNSFKTKEKELLKEAFSLARFIQKVCVNDDVAEDVVIKFKNIISSIQEEI